MDGDLRTTYVGALGSSVEPRDADVVLGVIRENYDFLEHAVDRNVDALAPPRSLLDTFKRVEESAERDGEPDATRIAWDSVNYRGRYLAYLDTSRPSGSVEAIREALGKSKRVWLVCLEADDTFCHRRLLAARVRGEEPAPWRDLYEPVEREEEREEHGQQASLGSFGGGSA